MLTVKLTKSSSIDPQDTGLRASREPAMLGIKTAVGLNLTIPLEEGKTVGAVARELDLTESALRQWVERARADRSGGRTGLTTAEREELARLRKENRILAEERDILKKATAFFAKQSR